MSTAQNQPLTPLERSELEAWVTVLEITTSRVPERPNVADVAMIEALGFDDWCDYCANYNHDEAVITHERDLVRLGALRKMLEWDLAAAFEAGEQTGWYG